MFGPNISGSIKSASGYEILVDNTFTATGALQVQYSKVNGADGGGSYANQSSGFDISAQRSSQIYGGSSTVQPSSVRLLPCIKS